MRKNMIRPGIALLGVILLFANCADKGEFEKYFKPQTLRVDYIHESDINDDTYTLTRYAIQGGWYKSEVNLIDTFEYGNQKVEVFDKKSGKLLYSESYNTLSDEYRITPEGMEHKKEFEESVLVPLPKRDAKIVFSTRKVGEEYSQKRVLDYSKNEKPATLEQECRFKELHVVAGYDKAFDLVIIPEGYAIQDSVKLMTDIERCSNAILNCTPFKNNSERLNIRALLSYSEESGISRESDKETVKNTVLGTSFYTFDIERYLMLESVWKMHDLCAHVPYESIIILCNTNKYGGGGIYNWYATVSDNEFFDYVCIHELGHSIAGLADEYYEHGDALQSSYSIDYEPVEPNITSLVHFERKWKSMLAPSTPIPTPLDKDNLDLVGVFEGAGYMEKGLYRPWQECSMKSKLYDRFCPVCSEAFDKMFDFRTK